MRLRRQIGLLTALLGVAFALLLGLGSAATAQTTNPPLVVNDDGNEDDDDRTDGVCATSGGVCTLRAAMTQANNNPGPDAIHFNIPGGGVHTIELGGEELPAINDPSGSVTIDGYTQPGATPNTDPLIFNAEILIEINGQNTDYTFLIQASENLFRGLSIYDTDVAFELLNENADGNVIVGNILGSNHDTTYERPGTGIGIRMNTGPDQNTIGTPDLADRNVISGNGSYGIRINHGPSSFNIIQNNIIGLDRTGTKALNQFIGVDLQFFTFRNQVGGLGPNEGNLMGGHRNGAMDFSHSSVNNSVLGNRIGTLPDGVGYTSETANRYGVIVKDDPNGNYVAHNIIRGNRDDGIWHKQNYTGGNTFAFNEITDNGKWGAWVTGHDDIYFDNIVAGNGNGGINFNNSSTRNNSNFPDELTERNSVRLGHFYGHDGLAINVIQGAHPNESRGTITGLGPGAVFGEGTCGGCLVDFYVSGTVNADRTVSPGAAPSDWTPNELTSTWLGAVEADANGDFSMASPVLQPGVVVWAVATTPDGESSRGFGHTEVESPGFGIGLNPSAPLPAPAAPAQPLPPIPYQPTVFDCGANSGTLSWTNVGANEYFVFATTDGTETYLGGHSGTSLSVAGADSYRVTEWSGGFANTTTCAGPGPDAPPPAFSCTANGNLLSWDDEGANEYYVRTVNDGVETFIGGFAGTSATVAGADSYKVIHWTGGRNEATCAGPGPGQQPVGFTCTSNGNTLTWTDEGASEYFVRTVNGGVETFVGGFAGTSATVAGADSYKVIHWTGGRNEATCAGPGPDAPPPGFTCSVSGSILSWTDEGASTYYVRTVTGGVETFLNGFSGLSATVPAADSYKVIHWIGGRNETTCS